MAIDRSTLKLPFDPGDWVDADRMMFHACFVILGDFVENELGKDEDGDGHCGYRLHAADIEDDDPSGLPAEPSRDRKAIDLWLWYRDEYPKLVEDYCADIAECYSGDLKTEEMLNGLHLITSLGQIKEPKYPYDYPEVVADEKLRELIEIRKSLWT